MTKKKLTTSMLVPKYVTQFQCTGGNCPDTCCTGWQVPIDRDSFRDYRRVTHPALKPLFQTYLVQVDKDSYPLHGRINARTSEMRCVMLSDENLCSIQKALGEDALSDTCHVYPRSVVQFGDRVEQSLTLSCPEAARLALTQEDAFEFTVAEFSTRQATMAVTPATHGFDFFAMDEVRAFIIQLFQTSALSNVERLAILGWLCSQLDELAASGSHHRVHEVLGELTTSIENGSIQKTVSQLARQSAVAASVFSILFGRPLRAGRSDNQQTVLAWVSQGLGLDATTGAVPDTASLEANYLRGLGLLQSDGGTAEKILTRYLLNDVLRETFPWNQSSALFNYRQLLTRFGIVRLMLAATAAALDKPLDEAEMVQVVQVFCRIYQHSDTFAKHSENVLSGANWDTLDRLYALLN
ncbi:MAG: flagellin lysine-N-methylase [Rhodoferax sp.]